MSECSCKGGVATLVGVARLEQLVLGEVVVVKCRSCSRSLREQVWMDRIHNIFYDADLFCCSSFNSRACWSSSSSDRPGDTVTVSGGVVSLLAWSAMPAEASG